MKNKLFFTFLIAVAFGFTSIGQNLVLNPGLEDWTDDVPDNWAKAENISPATDIIHGGTYSAMQTSASGAKDLQQDLDGIVGGTEYTISYWYYDNDPAARTRIWAYWMNNGEYLDDNAEELRANVYSEENSEWQQFSVTLNAPATANQFRFEVRVYKQDGNTGGVVYYDDFVFTGDVTIDPEPDEYPLNFNAMNDGTSINVSWSDPMNGQLPLGYILYASTTSNLPTPVDGTPVENDTDLSDGAGAINVAYGTMGYTFAGLESNTTYYFSIYPYTNTGANIDYKTDAGAPLADATIEDITNLLDQDFESGFDDWTTISVTGDQVWEIVQYGNIEPACAKMTGYASAPYENEDWLISPSVNFNFYSPKYLSFYTAMNYTGDPLILYLSDDYEDGMDPEEAEWTEYPYTPSAGSWAWTASGVIDVTGFSAGENVHIAFKFTSDTDGSATWEVDDIILSSNGGSPLDPEPTNYPTDFASTVDGLTINNTWTDAIGAQLPSQYLLIASTSTFAGVADGQAFSDDLDFSDGFAALNVAYGVETASFTALANTTYHLYIYPYTNSGLDIDFKNDGTVPQTTVTTEDVSPLQSIFEQDFESGWEDWTTVSVIGEQEWAIVQYGNIEPACAKMTGYDGAPFENEDWLISPSFNANNFTGESLSFYTAMNYNGNDLQLFISSDYTSGDPNAANWEELSFNLSPGSWEWTLSNVDLSSYSGTNVHIAFKFTSNETSSATWEVDDIKLEGQPTGINKRQNISFELYPNPSKGTFYLSNNTQEEIQVRVYNILGSVVYSTTTDKKFIPIQLKQNAGTYFVQVRAMDSNTVSSRKLIIR